jgi:hypothetical protein
MNKLVSKTFLFLVMLDSEHARNSIFTGLDFRKDSVFLKGRIRIPAHGHDPQLCSTPAPLIDNRLCRGSSNEDFYTVLRIRIQVPGPFRSLDPGWTKDPDPDPRSGSGLNQLK